MDRNKRIEMESERGRYKVLQQREGDIHWVGERFPIFIFK